MIGTQLRTVDGRLLHVVGAEHAGESELVAVGDVLTTAFGESYTVTAGDDAVVILDGAAEGTGQRVGLAPVTGAVEPPTPSVPRSRGRRNEDVAPA